ncbi:four helix bundle protein [Flavobacterium sp. xlx-214]|uniref:four helix bundle protein n=1 Tax=unclassified Flavobacterium TaxID=196869 RepID=UPI0013D5F066|nr:MULTISPECIES: four helix bundle protein [unclassified Flavobacterium]MBA5791955.1 four helix bundle protein [Flavobacterium sp. xlx-221]QMI84210.1 four helix bundle protein [Flavobacterium sp. xlx-214]
MRNYKQLQVWEKSHHLTLEIYKELTVFPKDEIFGLISQMKRSSSSIPTNIAEGAGRFTNKDFARFLSIAYGSCNELEYQIILSVDLRYLDANNGENLKEKIQEIRKMLYALINKLNNSETDH